MSKKIFISYRFSGEDPHFLKNTIPKLHEALEKCGHTYYSTFFDAEEFERDAWTGREIMDKAFLEIDSSDMVLFFVQSPALSQGMLMELGYSIAKNKKMILVIKDIIKTSIFRRHVNQVIEFKQLSELKEKLKKIEF